MARGKQPWNCVWLSICSRHYKYQADCNLCNAGYWRNRTMQTLSHFIYKRWPRLWRRWANSRWNEGARRRLESMFPNLRSDQ